jgi:hypothetical protein
VTFVAGGINGTARITASSGGATSGADGAVTIAVGTAAVGRITLTANPSTISSNGGIATITANVVDINGNPLSAAPVNFATSAGALAAAVVTTDSSGVAQTSLTTSTEATVTATVGVQAQQGNGDGNNGSTAGQSTATVTVDVNPVPTVSITGPGGTNTAGSPINFTISASPGTDSIAQIKEVVVSFGDGDVVNLGAVSGSNITVQHTYADDGTYTVRVTVTDTLGGTTSAATVIVLLPEPPLTVSIAKTSSPSGANTNYTLTATVTPPSVTVASYLWTLDDSSTVQSGSSNQLLQTFPTGESHKITVRVTTTSGQEQATSIFLP